MNKLGSSLCCTCFASVLHRRLIRGLCIEALQRQLLVFCGHSGLLVHDVDWRLIPLSAFWVSRGPALVWPVCTWERDATDMVIGCGPILKMFDSSGSQILEFQGLLILTV